MEAQREWMAPAPLGSPAPQGLPIEELPAALWRMALTVAEATQTPTDLATLLSFVTVSAATAGKAIIDVRPGHSEPLNIYGVAVMAPGTRKSAVFRLMTQPLLDFEDAEMQRLKGTTTSALERESALQQRLGALRKSYASGRKEVLDEIEAVRLELDALDIPRARKQFITETTPERLAQILLENNGACALLSAEGDPLRIFGGHYSQNSPMLGLLKSGWTGSEPFRAARVGREDTYVRRPTLTVGLTVQPGFIDGLANLSAFRGEGLLARFLWVVPEDNVGRRITGADVPPLSRDVARDYAELIEKLLRLNPAGQDADGSWLPHRLSLSPDAIEVLYAFEAEVEELLAVGGALRPMRDWGSKLVGNTIRLAGLIHASSLADLDTGPWAHAISGRALESAIWHARAFMTHAISFLSDLEQPLLVRDARDLVRILQERQGQVTTVRDLHQALRGRKNLKTVDAIRDVLDYLVEHNQLRIEAHRPGARGRPPSEVVVLNPALHDTLTIHGNGARPVSEDTEE